jgi:hypothetical protein
MIFHEMIEWMIDVISFGDNMIMSWCFMRCVGFDEMFLWAFMVCKIIWWLYYYENIYGLNGLWHNSMMFMIWDMISYEFKVLLSWAWS